MKFRIIPRAEGFYDLFVRSADNVLDAGTLLQELLTNYAERDSLRERITQLEHDGDEITHQVMRLINTTFVTPFDREDIYRLASSLDDVLDEIEAVADFMVLYGIVEPLPEMAKQADVLVRAAGQTVEALSRLRSFRDLEKYWVEVNRLENEGDRLYRRIVAHLYGGEYKAMDVMKHKDVVDHLEGAIDALEDVANTIESIVLKQA